MSTLVTALQAVAAAENTAIYAYSVAGARLSERRLRDLARSYYDVHRAQLQVDIEWLTAQSATAAAPPPVYSLPQQVADDVTASSLLARIEESIAAAYADLVAVATSDTRRLAATTLQAAAIRASDWRGTSVPFPGLVGRLSNLSE